MRAKRLGDGSWGDGRQGDRGTRGQGDKGTRGQGDEGTGGRGDEKMGRCGEQTEDEQAEGIGRRKIGAHVQGVYNRILNSRSGQLGKVARVRGFSLYARRRANRKVKCRFFNFRPKKGAPCSNLCCADGSVSRLRWMRVVRSSPLSTRNRTWTRSAWCNASHLTTAYLAHRRRCKSDCADAARRG